MRQNGGSISILPGIHKRENEMGKRERQMGEREGRLSNRTLPIYFVSRSFLYKGELQEWISKLTDYCDISQSRKWGSWAWDNVSSGNFEKWSRKIMWRESLQLIISSHCPPFQLPWALILIIITASFLPPSYVTTKRTKAPNSDLLFLRRKAFEWSFISYWFRSWKTWELAKWKLLFLLAGPLW